MTNGKLAKEFCNKELPLEVLKSRAGYYIGTSEHHAPFSRESMEYWPEQQDAEMALKLGLWHQKLHP